MEIKPLSATHRETFDRDGFLVIPKVLTDAECDKLETFANAAVKRHAPQADTGLEATQTQIQLRLALGDHPEFIPIVGQPLIVSIVAQLLSSNIHVHTVAVLFKHSYIGKGLSADEVVRRGGPRAVFEAESAGWHRDIGITEDVGHSGVFKCGIKACYALSDLTSPMAGMTMFARGSHLIHTPLAVANGQPVEHEVVQPALRRGDVCMFENRIFHTGTINMTEVLSKCVIIGYAYRWVGGHRSNMELVWPPYPLLNDLDPVTQQLLGGSGEFQPDLVALMSGARRGGKLSGQSAQAESADFVWTRDVESTASKTPARL